MNIICDDIDMFNEIREDRNIQDNYITNPLDKIKKRTVIWRRSFRIDNVEIIYDEKVKNNGKIKK